MTDEETEDSVDITSVVKGCASSLTLENSLLCDEASFDLQESMAALELLDRKMDCCEIPASTITHTALQEDATDYMVPPRPLPTGIDDEIAPLPWEDLSLHDACLIALEALTRLESMLSGASVAESIYSCLYTHNAVLADMKFRLQNDKQGSSPAQHAVYATSLAMVAIGKVVREIVLNADIYEEEDFSAQTYDLEFFDGVTFDETVEVMEYGMEYAGNAEVPVEDVRTIQLIIGFELDFLKACVSMEKPNSGRVLPAAMDTKKTVTSGLDKLTELTAIISERILEDLEEAALMRRCFDPFMYRILVGNAPVRKVAFRKPTESISILTTILSEIGWAACDLLIHGTTLAQTRSILYCLSKSSLNVLSRSMMVLNLYFDDKFMGQHFLPDLMIEDLKRLASAPDSLFTAPYGQAFISRLAKPVYDTLKLCLLNRNRQQAYLEAVMIPDWSSLQQDARVVDVNYCMENELPPTFPPFLSHYVLCNLTWLMDHYIALGIELGLFHGHHDLAVAYWYRDVLLSSLLNTLTAMRRTKLDAQKQEHVDTSNSKGKKKGGKGSAKRGTDGSLAMLTQQDLANEFDFMLVSLKRGLCRGLTRFIAALCQAEVLSPESYEFTTHKRRFEKRFEPFAGIVTPAPLTFNDFLVGSDFSRVKQADLLSATTESFSAAKGTVNDMVAKYKAFDSVSVKEEELKSLAKVCVGNSVYVTKLSQQIKGGEKASGKVVFDFETNSEFCMIKIA